MIDIGFGDATEPGIEMLDYPVLLHMPAPRLRGYAPETVVAETLQAIIALGRVNSRMKNYFDLWMLLRSFDFKRPRLAKAVSATFTRRRTFFSTITLKNSQNRVQRKWLSISFNFLTADSAIQPVSFSLSFLSAKILMSSG